MYGWIWRKLPFGLPGKLIGSLVLLGGVAALLWFVVFPATAPLMPFNQSTIGEPTDDDSDGGDPGEITTPSFDPSDYELEPSPDGS